MSRRTALPSMVALLTAGAMLAGCSSGGGEQDAGAFPSIDGDASALDSDGVGAPEVALPYEDEEEEGEEYGPAAVNPYYADGVPNSSLEITGYHADIDVLALPATAITRAPKREMPTPHPIEGGEAATTGAVQTDAPTSAPPPIDVNVAGLDYDSWGAGHPPDTSGAVGPEQYVQAVNTSIGIYDKSGERLNAFTYNTFFSEFDTGTPCDNQNGGDPQVLFDRPSNKWIVADLSYAGPYYFCMAVSSGPDLTDTDWTLYPYLASETELNDYPKISSGPNGLFMTANMFLNARFFDGAQVWAFKRSSLGADKLKVQTVRTSSDYGSLLPANSYAAEKSKGPNYLVSLESSNRVGLWEYKVNWKKPRKTKFTDTPTLIPVESYQPAGRVQLRNGSAVDTLSDRPMYQLQQAADGSLWFNHSVQVGSQVGVRWYQLDVAGAEPEVLQQSTYAPGSDLSRWMGSLAVDQDGNMAVGYSTASPTEYPSIAYATRLATDPLNKLTSEGSIAEGKGSQTGISRWGDYSQMSIDPVDSCTFWYTQEYYLETGVNWQTRIASFKFPGCK